MTIIHEQTINNAEDRTISKTNHLKNDNIIENVCKT